MILTCPSCGTQYVVKDGAIPPSGRQVRCKACQHSWREFPASTDDTLDLEREAPQATPEPESEPIEQFPVSEPIAELPQDAGEAVETAEEYERDEPLAEEPVPPPIPPEAEVTHLAEAAPSHRLEWVERDEDFSPFAPREPERMKSRKGLWIGFIVLLIVAIVAAVWFLAPPEIRQRLGIAETGETPLKLMMTHTDRSPLASGNDLLNISGRIINPTDKQQNVPQIFAQLHDAKGKVVYKWTIAPPLKTLPPGGSASFNSAELNIPQSSQDLTVSLGEPKL